MPATAEPDFEVIVIGAGIAGCVTAYQLARQGRSVLLIERGESAGSKNLSGGVLYTRGIQQVFPEFLDEAPVERRITRNYVSFLNAGSSVAIDYKDSRLADPVNAVTVLRVKLDAWLAGRCEEAGVLIMPGVRVDRVLTQDGAAGKRVVGVQAGDDELRAHVVVAADGVNSFIAKEVGLRKQEPLNHLAVGVKSVVSLPRDTIGEIAMDGMLVVGDAAGLTLNTGLTVRGMDLAVASAVAAAEGIGSALDRGDTSKAGLAGYRETFFASYAGQDMKTYARAPAFLELERMYKHYGEFFADVLYGTFNLDTQPRRHLLKVARKALKHSPLKTRHLVSDGIA